MTETKNEPRLITLTVMQARILRGILESHLVRQSKTGVGRDEVKRNYPDIEAIKDALHEASR